MILFRRQTGARGADAQYQLKEYYPTKFLQLWKAVPVKKRSFSPPQYIPQQKQNFHKSRLEELYPQQQETLQRRKFNKQLYSCINNNATSSVICITIFPYM